MLKLIKKGELSAVTYGEVGSTALSCCRSRIWTQDGFGCSCGCGRGCDCGCGCGGRRITIRHECSCGCDYDRLCRSNCICNRNRDFLYGGYVAMDSDQRRAHQHRPCAVIGPDRHPPPPPRAHPHSHPLSHPHSHPHLDTNPRPHTLQAPPTTPLPHYPSPYVDPLTHSEPLKPHYEPHKNHFEAPKPHYEPHKTLYEPSERFDPAYQLNHRQVPYNVEYPDYQRYQTAPAPIVHNPAERVPYDFPPVAYPRLPSARYEPYPQIKDKYIHSRYEYQYPYNQYPPQTYADLRKRVKTQTNDPQFYQVPHPQTFYPTAKVQTNVPCNIVDIANQKYHTYHARQKQYVQTPPSYNTTPKVVQDPNKVKLDYYNRCRAPAPYPNIHYPNENYHIANYGVPNFNYGVRSPSVHYPNVYYHKQVEYRPIESEITNQKYYNPKYVTNNPLARIPTEFSPNVISPAESSASFESVRPGSYQLLQEDGGYVSQCSTLSRQSEEYQPSAKNEYYNQSCSRPCQGSFETLSPKIIVKQPSIDKPALDLRQFLEMWDEEYEDPKLPNAEIANVEQGNSFAQQPTNAAASVPEQLYVLDKTIISEDELKKYEHLQKVTKLPDFIKDVETNCNKIIQKDVKYQHPIKTPLKNKSQNLPMNQNRPIMRAPEPELFNNELIDVEAKISQSVIHKEVGCNFEIKPCSPTKLLSVEIPPEKNKPNVVSDSKNKSIPHVNSSCKKDLKQYPGQVINRENNAAQDIYNVSNKIERNKNIPKEASNNSLPVIHSDEILVGAPISYKNQTNHYSTPNTMMTTYRDSNFNYSSSNTHGKVNVIMNPLYAPHKNSQKEKNDPQLNTSYTTNHAQVIYDNSYMNECKSKNADGGFTYQKYENYEYYSKISKVNNANFPKCSVSVEKSNESFYAVNENPLRNGDHWIPKSNENSSNLHYESVKSDVMEKLPSLNDITALPMINSGDIKKIDTNTTNCRTVICRNKSNTNNRDIYQMESNSAYSLSNFNNTSQQLNKEHSYQVFSNNKPQTEYLKRSDEMFKNDAYLTNTTGRHMRFDNIRHSGNHGVTPSISNDSTASSNSAFNSNHSTQVVSSVATEILDNESKSSIIVQPITQNIQENILDSPKNLDTLLLNGNPKTDDIISAVSCESKFPQIELYKEDAQKNCENPINDVAHDKNNSVIVKSCENTLTGDNKIDISIKSNNLNELVENYLEEVEVKVSTELPCLTENDDDIMHGVNIKRYENSTNELIEGQDDFVKPISNSNFQFDKTNNSKTNESHMEINFHLDENNETSITPDVSNPSKDICEVVTNDINDDHKIIHNEYVNQTNVDTSETVHLDKTELPCSLVSTKSLDSLSTDDCDLNEENSNEDINAVLPLVESVKTLPKQLITMDAPEIYESTKDIDSVNSECINEDVDTIAIGECLDESIIFDKFESKTSPEQSEKVNFCNDESKSDDVRENQDVMKDDNLCDDDDCDEIAFKNDNCNILLKSESMDEHETYISFEGDKVDYFSADFDYDSRYVIIRTDEHLSYAAADSSENDFTCDEHASDMTLEESHMSPNEIREKLNSEDGNGLEIGGCWIDDIACVETVVAEETIQDSTDCYKSPEEFWNIHHNDETTNSPISYDQDSDSDVLKDSNSNVIMNYKEQIIDNSNDSTKCSLDSSYKVQKYSSSYDSSTRTSEESTERNYKKHHKLKIYKSHSSDRKEYVKKDYSRKRSSSDGNSKISNTHEKYSLTNNELCKFSNNEMKTKGAQKFIPSTNSSDTDLKCQLPLPENKLLTLGKLVSKDDRDTTKDNRIKNRMVLPKKPCKPKFEDVLRNIDKVSMSQMKMKFKKHKNIKREIPKVIIKRNEQGSHYTSSSRQTSDKSTVKNKWQPQVCLSRNNSIDKMVKYK